MKGSIFMDHHILMKNVWKKFGEITALRDANLMVKKNTIHAIVGENSAGKSTLVRILAGIERMDQGEIWISGRKVKIRNARDSLKLGIGMVHQHLALIEDFTVAENLFAVGMDDPLNIVTKKRLRQNAKNGDLESVYKEALRIHSDLLGILEYFEKKKKSERNESSSISF